MSIGIKVDEKKNETTFTGTGETDGMYPFVVFGCDTCKYETRELKEAPCHDCIVVDGSADRCYYVPADS